MKYPIGILDYGIGGMGLAKLIQDKYPDGSYLYFSDSGYIPYGKLPATELSERVQKMIKYLFAQGCEHVVVACHAASSVLESDTHLTTMIPITIDSVIGSGKKSIGIMGGKRTIESNVYRDAIESRGLAVRQEVAQELSIFIERGEVTGDELIKQINRIVAPLNDCEAILLACTHYPAISSLIQKEVGSGCLLIDPCEMLMGVLTHKIHWDKLNQRKFLTTGDPQLMKEAAFKAFGIEVGRAEQVEISLG